MTAGIVARAVDFPELAVQNVAGCQVAKGFRLIGAPVEAETLYLVLAGTMHMRVAGQRIVAPPGHLVLLPPNLQPSIAPSASAAVDIVATRSCLIQRGGLLVFDAAHGGPGDLRVLVGRIAGDVAAALDGVVDPAMPFMVDLREQPLAAGIYAALLAEMDDPRPGVTALFASLAKACLLLLVRAGQERLDHGALGPLPSSNRLAGVVAAILARPAGKHRVDLLAEQAGMSRATFARRFAEATGTSPMDFVQRARLQEAAALLRTTDMPVKQIAIDSGFLSRSHFSRAFVAMFGASPTDFRIERPDGPPALFGGPDDPEHSFA